MILSATNTLVLHNASRGCHFWYLSDGEHLDSEVQSCMGKCVQSTVYNHSSTTKIIMVGVYPGLRRAKLMDAVEAKAKQKTTLGVFSCREDVISFFI